MKVTVLNGFENSEISGEIVDTLINEFKKKKFSIQSYNLCDIEIGGCIGCFGCWLRTPGICVINDSARDLGRELIQSELALFLTPITFGGYSYHLKKVLDRMIPLISPLFQKINGEVHHQKRYDIYPSIIGIGFLPDQDKESESIFHTLVKSNAVNFHSPYYASAVFYENQPKSDFQNVVQNLLIKAGV